MKIIVDYAKGNEPYIEKGAVVLHPRFKSVINLGIKLTGRKNLRAFSTEKEALEWLEKGD